MDQKISWCCDNNGAEVMMWEFGIPPSAAELVDYCKQQLDKKLHENASEMLNAPRWYKFDEVYVLHTSNKCPGACVVTKDDSIIDGYVMSWASDIPSYEASHVVSALKQLDDSTDYAFRPWLEDALTDTQQFIKPKRNKTITLTNEILSELTNEV